jgi:hypothetical protein
MFSLLLEKGEPQLLAVINQLMTSDGNVRYYEYENDSLHFLSEYKSSDPREDFTYYATE